MAVRISNTEERMRFTDAVTKMTEKYKLSNYYTADHTEMTHKNMLGKMKHMLEVAALSTPETATIMETKSLRQIDDQKPAAARRSAELEKDKKGSRIGSGVSLK
jgi:hypothetical protein